MMADILVLNVHSAFRMSIAKITSMRWAKVNFSFVDRISDFVGEDTG